MDASLKARMLTAAVGADQIYQREWAKALTEGVAEIERLQNVLHKQVESSMKVSQAMLTTLPYLRRIEQPTPEMCAAMIGGETPFSVRRKSDSSEYEVVRADSPNWREAAGGEDQTVVFTGSEEHAEKFCRECAFYWRYDQMLQIAAKQPVPNPEQPA